MELRKIGSLEVSVVGLGCNNFGGKNDEASTAAVVSAALDAGINFFDTADIYGGTKSETFLGSALKGNGRREEAILGTKFGMRLGDDNPGGGSPAWVRQACDDSLRRLQVDVIDLYQYHKPDPEVPLAETLGAMQELVVAGKVREIGCSNMTAAELREADEAVNGGGARFVTVQNYFNLLHREDEAEVLPTAASLGIGYLPYFPLQSGLLSGKYRRGEAAPEGTRLSTWGKRGAAMLDDESFDIVDRLTGWAEAHGHTILELAFAWLAAKEPVVSVIAGATSPAQVASNAAAGAWKLSPEELAEVDGRL
jgi:aryl-alcohol dehydrogenase-like predicted oxidoreductase